MRRPTVMFLNAKGAKMAKVRKGDERAGVLAICGAAVHQLCEVKGDFRKGCAKFGVRY
jgi:hypothetical protein